MRKNNDYSEIEQKRITSTHAAAVIALSRYEDWSANTEDQTDMFKRDGLNYRRVNILIDGEPFFATVVTALNDDPSQSEDYGEKFYDIQGIKKSEDQAHVTNGTLNLPSAGRATPYQIKYVGGLLINSP